MRVIRRPRQPAKHRKPCCRTLATKSRDIFGATHPGSVALADSGTLYENDNGAAIAPVIHVKRNAGKLGKGCIGMPRGIRQVPTICTLSR